MMTADWLETSSETTEDEDLPVDEILDEADEFEEQLAADMLRTGAIEVWT